MPVFFSIVIPSFNRAQFIRAVIKSFLDQEHKHFEIIIVDDGSKDNTEEVIKGFNDKRISYYYKENGERGAARNFGAARAKGEYVTFFDSDDVAYPWYLAHAADELAKLNKPECYAQAFEFRPEIPLSYPVMQNTNGVITTANDKLENDNFLACNGVFVRKDVLNEFSFSNNRDLSGSEDWVLWLQLAANFTFYYSPLVCSCLVNHGGRGELNIVASKLVKRAWLLLRLFHTDEAISKFSPSKKRKVMSSGYLFVALKLADFRGYKLKSINYLIRAFLLRPAIISKRNFYVTQKKLLFSWHSLK